jgi:UDP-galactopyranose mutase
MAKYDYLIVGAGLYGATLANLLKNAGKSVLICEKRPNIGGNVYTEKIDGIDVHMYGAHIFHTSDENIWNYVNSFVPFKPFMNTVLANYKGKLYNLPFNMNTFEEMWGVKTKEEAMEKIESQKRNYKKPQNLEEQAISLVGTDIYNTLIKGYTEKQWGRKATELPAFIIKRIPLRFEYNNNYFNDVYQGIPSLGYTELIKRIIGKVDVMLNTDFLKHPELKDIANMIIYTGAIDEYFDYKFGELEYRSLRFDIERINKEYYQNNCVINFTEFEVPYTRIIEHKYFLDTKTPTTVITREYPVNYKKGMERYYSVNNEKNDALYNEYFNESNKIPNVYFGGRLGKYKYFDMDDSIAEAFRDCQYLLGK